MIDTQPPIITLPFYSNMSQYLNTTTLYLDILLNDTFSGLINSICIVNINGTNQSFSVSNNWCNASSPLTGLADGNYNIKIYVNDSFNNLGINEDYFFNTVSSKPAISINSPIGVKTSTNVSFDFTIDTIGTLDYCSYNVTTPTFTIIVPENDINCSNLLEYQTIGDTGGVSYIVNVFANDTLGNFNTLSTTFSVDLTQPSLPSQGGGGVTIITTGNWTMETEFQGSSYQFSMIQSSSRNRDLLFENTGITSRTIKLTCEIVSGPSNYVMK